MSWFGIVSYLASALAYGAVAAILLLGRPGSRPARWCAAATALTAVWAVATVLAGRWDVIAAYIGGLDAAHSLIWTAAISSFLVPAGDGSVAKGGRGLRVGAAAACLTGFKAYALNADHIAYLGLVLMAAIGLLAVEQVVRNAHEHERGALRLLCVAVGGVFVVNLFVYSHAALLGGLLQVLWESRGIVFAALAPFVMLGLRHQPEWALRPFVSRHMVFYTATLLAVGIYLSAMAAIAYVLRAIGGGWSVLLELVFLIAAVLVLGVVLFSRTLRAHARVFLAKHFYRSKYDYRSEWLRITDLLARAPDTQSLARAGLEGIARIVGSDNGSLWMTRDGSHYERWLSLSGRSEEEESFDAEHSMVRFLAARGWVIDTQQYQRSPDHYDNAFGPVASGVLPANALIVPLDCRGDLLGFIVLAKPAAVGSLNFDDHDILKTAGKQFAAFFAQALAQEQLSETRQFEAMNKLSTFLMHDLKNLIAQQELVVKNAQRFGHQPEFFQDAIETVRSGVERMKKVVSRLRVGALQQQVTSRADVSRALMEVRSQCADREPIPRVRGADAAVWVQMDRDRLVSILTHLVRNAQDATSAEGEISVTLEAGEREVSLMVSDTGEGMDAEFVRDRLFRPFDSTKGADGMGIGVYQVRELVRAVGGDVQVRSNTGQGTTFHIRLPRDQAVDVRSALATRGMEMQVRRVGL